MCSYASSSERNFEQTIREVTKAERGNEIGEKQKLLHQQDLRTALIKKNLKKMVGRGREKKKVNKCHKRSQWIVSSFSQSSKPPSLVLAILTADCCFPAQIRFRSIRSPLPLLHPMQGQQSSCSHEIRWVAQSVFTVLFFH